MSYTFEQSAPVEVLNDYSDLDWSVLNAFDENGNFVTKIYEYRGAYYNNVIGMAYDNPIFAVKAEVAMRATGR